MSDELKNESGDEPINDDVAGESTEGTQTGGETSQTDSAQETETGEFDAAEYEHSFGLPAGSLKDAKSADDALEIIRSFTDKSLIAGLGMGTEQFVGGATPLEKAGTDPTEKGKKAEPTGNAEIDALRAELVEVKTTLQKQAEQQEKQILAELDRRVLAEIDSWESPKYGAGKNRNFKQVKATRELRDLLTTHVAGLQATGQPIPLVESVLRQVRVFHEEDYKPKKQQTKAAPLGTPGTGGKAAKGDGKPRNIHEALMGNTS